MTQSSELPPLSRSQRAGLAVALGAFAVHFAEYPEVDANELLLLTPLTMSGAILIVMVTYFWRRDRQLPILDVGTLCALITLIYVAVPTIFYIESGLKWSSLSDARLVQMGTTPADVAEVLWYVVAYLAALCATYSLLRGVGMPGPRIAIPVSRRDGWTLLKIFAMAAVYKFAVESFFEVSLSPSTRELQASYGSDQLPLIWGQITHNVLGIMQISMLGLVAFVFATKSRALAVVLTICLLVDGYITVANMGERTSYAALILATVLCYHRIIRPIGPILAALIAVALLAALLAYGIVRDGRIGLEDVWSAASEFQVLLANGIHVGWAQARGILGEVPWQITYNDLLLPFPQQLLPFEKLDVSQWYVHQIGWDNQGLGLLFGVVAQSRIGFGLPEIIVRGAVLGVVLAFIHRLCVKRADSITALIVYLWLCVSIYYTYRASTFYIATWAIYRVVPFVLLFRFFRRHRVRGRTEAE